MTESQKKGSGAVFPLMIGGCILTAIGFYMALADDSAQPQTEAQVVEKAQVPSGMPKDLAVDASAQKLTFKAPSETHLMKLTQTSTRADSATGRMRMPRSRC